MAKPQPDFVKASEALHAAADQFGRCQNWLMGRMDEIEKLLQQSSQQCAMMNERLGRIEQHFLNIDKRVGAIEQQCNQTIARTRRVEEGLVQMDELNHGQNQIPRSEHNRPCNESEVENGDAELVALVFVITGKPLQNFPRTRGGLLGLTDRGVIIGMLRELGLDTIGMDDVLTKRLRIASGCVAGIWVATGCGADYKARQ
ncbi:hypothetical protein GGR57DRAFT_506076 [Xylariaceae sp. FL1272]|nr:hypothetical protein GGR57DRAFT_506076 [Xylariaceae sp. FL1272]